MASLVLTVEDGALGVYAARRHDIGPAFSLLTIAKPLVGAATHLFRLQHSSGRDRDLLSTRQPMRACGTQNFLWSAPSYLSRRSAAIAATVIAHGGYWWASLAAARCT